MDKLLFRASNVSKLILGGQTQNGIGARGFVSKPNSSSMKLVRNPQEEARLLLKGAHLAIREGEIVALVGPSGVGKSTFFRICTGRLTGDELAGNRPYIWSKPEARLIWQPQEVPLVRTRRVKANVEIGALAAGGTDGQDLSEVSRASLRLVRLESVAQAYPAMLSVGMKQRVALARTLAALPRLAFLDEPLSSLDPQLRQRIAAELRAYVQEKAAGIALVTHTIEEAIDFATRIYVLNGNPGRIVLVAARSKDSVTEADRQEGTPIAVMESRGQLFERVLEAMTSTEGMHAT